MRLMLLTYRFGRDIIGGGERYMWDLVTRLAARGHDIEVFTTCARNMVFSPYGYLVWDDFLPRGVEEVGGVTVHRLPAKNPRPRKGRRFGRALKRYFAAERRSPGFALKVAETMRGIPEHCFLSGWHVYEDRADGPGRWMERNATLLVGGESLTELRMQVHSPLDNPLTVELNGIGTWEFEMERGRVREVNLSFEPCRGLIVDLKVPGTFVPPEDGRMLGLDFRAVAVRDGTAVRELDMRRDWDHLTNTYPETLLGDILWSAAASRPSSVNRMQRYLIGPRVPGLGREALKAAARCDLVLASMVPMATVPLAREVAAKAGKPLVIFPLFHARDPSHYWEHFGVAMREAAGVDANLGVMADSMRAWGFPAFAVGPGMDLGEFSAPHIDGGRFRSEFGFGDRPILLWVARKNVLKGYREAIETVERVRAEGIDAALVMIGPEEDYLPIGGEGVYYLGVLPREKVLDAFDACDLLVFPSLHESFCLVFCEAWLRGKPVLGNSYCIAARGLIEHGVDGYLCSDAEELGACALALLRHPAQARAMGERGREKVMSTRGWDHVIREIETMLTAIAGGTAGRA
ncbi:MAG: glycosyltransferase [Actinomycetota bacterium]|nr:glycosyltransferase [Actinomycetota bacterium]